MAALTRAMMLTRWQPGLSVRVMATLCVPIPGTQVTKLGRGYYNPNAVYFNVTPCEGQGAALLRDLAVTKEPIDADSRREAIALLSDSVPPSLPPGVALAAVITATTGDVKEARKPRASTGTSGSWQSAMPADVGGSFAVCEGTSPKVHGIERRRNVWCKCTERGHNAIVRRRARVEALIDGKGTPCWDGLPALMRKMPV